MQRKILLLLSIIILVIGYSVYQALLLDHKLSEGAQDRTGTVLTVLPDAFLNELNSDKLVNIKDLSLDGSAIVVHFWATWCGPCATEFPELMQLVNKMKTNKKVKFVFVAVQDEKKAMNKFLKKNKAFNLPNLVLLEDRAEVHRKLSTYKLPETIVFDSNNNVVRKFSGPQKWLSDYILNELKSLK